jgi:light-regulated signal transduction histidine kinase (bacteriophytochrome)
MESIEHFINVATHDLREPIRAIRSCSEALAAMCPDPTDDKVARNLRFVIEGADRMESLIRDLSQYCAEEVREFSHVPVSLSYALKEAQAELSAELKKTASIVTHDALPVVSGDAPALSLLFRCLLDNACKFRGEAPPRIHVTAVPEQAEWIVSVRDNGMGVKAEYCDRIFNPFERLNGRRYSGSWLGLALAKRIVERHGGRIRAEASSQQGSIFFFSLPAME